MTLLVHFQRQQLRRVAFRSLSRGPRPLAHRRGQSRRGRRREIVEYRCCGGGEGGLPRVRASHGCYALAGAGGQRRPPNGGRGIHAPGQAVQPLELAGRRVNLVLQVQQGSSSPLVNEGSGDVRRLGVERTTAAMAGKTAGGAYAGGAGATATATPRELLGGQGSSRQQAPTAAFTAARRSRVGFQRALRNAAQLRASGTIAGGAAAGGAAAGGGEGGQEGVVDARKAKAADAKGSAVLSAVGEPEGPRDEAGLAAGAVDALQLYGVLHDDVTVVVLVGGGGGGTAAVSGRVFPVTAPIGSPWPAENNRNKPQQKNKQEKQGNPSPILGLNTM